MITALKFITTANTDPYHNLALEKYLTMHTEPGECILYLWQNRKTVVIGKNQNAWKECKVDALREDGGHLVRRLSGGGAVYHDLGNLNFTFAVREEDYDVSRQLDVILTAVRKMGIEAEKTGRNDITADGRKFSGNAFFKSKGHCYHHGTLMLEVDTAALMRYLTVSKEKLQSKGIDSVRSRVVNLTSLNPKLTVGSLSEALRDSFGEIYGLPVSDLQEEALDKEEILEAATAFASWDWIYGRKIAFTNELSKRFPWGGIQLQLKVDAGYIQDAVCFSDAMDPEIAEAIRSALTGHRYELPELRESVQNCETLNEATKRDVTDLLSGM